MTDAVLVAVIAIALAFDFTNGFHDTANAVATTVSTRALPPRIAVLIASIANFAGAFVSTAVASFIWKDLLSPTVDITLSVRLPIRRRRPAGSVCCSGRCMVSVGRSSVAR